MSTNALTNKTNLMPSFINDFFKPWNDWFDNGFEKTLSVPAVNISESDGKYNVSVAAPGMKKDYFKIDVEGDVLTISAETEETNEEKDENFNRREYNYSSFSRSFTLPEEVKRDDIEAKYENGVLNIVLPKSEAAKKASKSISIK
jgi:HSP20 family protein